MHRACTGLRERPQVSDTNERVVQQPLMMFVQVHLRKLVKTPGFSIPEQQWRSSSSGAECIQIQRLLDIFNLNFEPIVETYYYVQVWSNSYQNCRGISDSSEMWIYVSPWPKVTGPLANETKQKHYSENRFSKSISYLFSGAESEAIVFSLVGLLAQELSVETGTIKQRGTCQLRWWQDRYLFSN